ncbi:hypothetical protein [Cohnella panacarvi]|uniref:hypothetical protein n=1 Tax=Cohnella panacarvi TaxID=400776 RepID=UPI00047E99C6|nr:hypothetical protein [Cohnella panacarvi]
MSNFENAYVKWLDMHKASAGGERLRRLNKRHGFGEKLLLEQGWWPVLGTLEHLHPEYEFIGINGERYFIDIAFILDLKLKPTASEADGFSSHARDIDRDQFSRALDRQNEIVLSNWNILRFSIDKLKENSDACQNTIRRMLVCWYGKEDTFMRDLNIYQRELVRVAIRSAIPFTAEDARNILGKKHNFTRATLQSLIQMNILEAASGNQRIHRYQLSASRNWRH